jgi:hypothetical protein
VSGARTLTGILQDWMERGGNLEEAIAPFQDRSIGTESDARAVCDALGMLLDRMAIEATPENTSALGSLIARMQDAVGPDAREAVTQYGRPHLRRYVRGATAHPTADGDSVLRVIEALTRLFVPEDVGLIVDAVRATHLAASRHWLDVFDVIEEMHPSRVDFVYGLSDPLPTGIPRRGLIDLANRCVIDGDLQRHPFDSETGRDVLSTWLRSHDPADFGNARSAAAALEFLSDATRSKLLPIASEHACAAVRIDAARTRVATGDNEGLRLLADLCRDPEYAWMAGRYLVELERTDVVPRSARSKDLDALTDFAEWISHPCELGRLPSEMKLMDARELYWPPTKDQRRLVLIEYDCAKPGREPEFGVGMVGTDPWSLFGDTSPDMAPEDIYGIHCSWELMLINDPRVPDEYSAEIGRPILAEHNDGF